MTFGSLFSGCGGMDLGLERAGMRCVWQVEIDGWCRKVLAKHWPDARRHDDVRTFTGDGYDVPDVIAGGDPCQGNSNAGSIYKRDHPDMGREFVRVVAALRPRIVVRENPYPSRADALWPWWRMRAELERVGYAVLPFRLRACCCGADHKRDRVFLLAERSDAHREPVRLQRRAADAGQAEEVCGEVRQQRVRPDAATVGGVAVIPDPDGDGLEGLDRPGFPSWNPGREVCRGMRCVGRDRLPTPRICRGTDGVRDRVHRLRALGNAVDVRVARWIGQRLMESDKHRRGK